jgi:hypothetical protein
VALILASIVALGGIVKPLLEACTQAWARHLTADIADVAALFICNIYFAVHDRRTNSPSVDWVQILIFFISLSLLPGARFFSTQYFNPDEWTDYLRERIYSMHSKADRDMHDAVNYQPGDTIDAIVDKLKYAESSYFLIDDLWCAANAASARADMWSTMEDHKKEQRARKAADTLRKRYNDSQDKRS